MAGRTRAPGGTVPQIRYALSQLRSRNGHHEFEHLCREITRVRISRNVLPATGPVSAGGDQGRDFETFRTFIQDRLPGSFLADEGDLRIVFACTLQREDLHAKIKKDLRVIMDGGRVDYVYFFCEQDIPVGKRRQWCQTARENHGVEITIIDGQALSELLAADDCLWIAERYLGVEVPGEQPGNATPWDGASEPFSKITGTDIRVGAIHGDVNIYHAEAPAGMVPAAKSRQQRPPAPSAGVRKRRQGILACLMAVAAAAVLGLILVPWHPSPSPHSPSSQSPPSQSPSSQSPGGVTFSCEARIYQGQGIMLDSADDRNCTPENEAGAGDLRYSGRDLLAGSGSWFFQADLQGSDSIDRRTCEKDISRSLSVDTKYYKSETTFCYADHSLRAVVRIDGENTSYIAIRVSLLRTLLWTGGEPFALPWSVN